MSLLHGETSHARTTNIWTGLEVGYTGLSGPRLGMQGTQTSASAFRRHLWASRIARVLLEVCMWGGTSISLETKASQLWNGQAHRLGNVEAERALASIAGMPKPSWRGNVPPILNEHLALMLLG
eukprot:2233430-Amphidinium_carterae.1